MCDNDWSPDQYNNDNGGLNKENKLCPPADVAQSNTQSQSSHDSPSDDDKTHTVLIPPIRSMSIRSPLHHTSTIALRDQPYTDGTLSPSRLQPARPTLSEVDFEKFRPPRKLSDAKPPKGEHVTPEKQIRRSERPSPIARRVTQYLENAQGQGLQTATAITSTRIHNLQPPGERKPDLELDEIPRPKQPSPVQLVPDKPKATPAPPVLSLSSHTMPVHKSIEDYLNWKTGADTATRTPVRTSPRRSRVHWELSPQLSSRNSSLGSRDDRPKFPLGLPPALKVNGIDLANLEESKTQDENELRIRPGHEYHFTGMFGIDHQDNLRPIRPVNARTIDLKGIPHVDLPTNTSQNDENESCPHAPSARNWTPKRKRLTATVACVNTSCIGTLLGIYAGEVPAIQYVIIDTNHYIILGNVLMYLGLASSALLLWPLPLLHGRKPYTVTALIIALCLQIPQGIAVSDVRLPDTNTWKSLLLVSRALSGFALGICDINLQATLLDLFGASLQSRNPHQEIADQYDIRRHGGGMGLWIGIWSWCSIGPISVGFMIGAFIINNASVTWGFWVSLLVLMIVLLLNVVSPEVRRSAFRRTLAEIQDKGGDYSRLARGEIKMHLQSEGPVWWGEELLAGLRLCRKMVEQPGFVILSLYSAWVYAQFTLILMLLGALASTVYHYNSVYVGLCVTSLAIGALAATPFQKASWLSRARWRTATSNSMTMEGKLSWSSHLARRTMFTLMLPITAVGFLLSSRSPPFPIVVPCIMAAFVGFFSALAIAECCGFMFETFDTSDLQPGMTGRAARMSVVRKFSDQWTNFSCYPRVSAGIAITQALKYCLAAAATGVCGRVEQRIGAVQATAVVAGILMLITILLAIVLFRWRTVQMVPELKFEKEEAYKKRQIWEPVTLGKPSCRTRKISIFEGGKMTRWSEIRRRNKMNTGLTGG